MKTSRFKSSVLFGTHTLLDKSLRVLQLPTQLTNLTVNESYCNSGLYSLGCKLIRVGWSSQFLTTYRNTFSMPIDTSYDS